MSDAEDYCILHNQVNALLHDIACGKVSELSLIYKKLKLMVEDSTGITFEEAYSLLEE